MKHYLILLLLFSGTHLLSAQNGLIVEGVVKSVDNQPIPWANVQYRERVFTITDSNGRFLLALPDRHVRDTITVSAMGYITYHAPLKQELVPGFPLTIIMTPEAYLLDGVTISKNQARNHWRKALQQLETNLPRTAYTYPALYRQVHQEDGTYVRLIEAGMTVYDVAVTYHAGILQERFSLEQVRRSNVMERNGDQHGDHLVDLFMENSLRYPVGTIMDTKVIAQFEIDFADYECTTCGDSLEMLTYHYKHASDPKVLEGKIWLYKGSMRLFALEETALRNPSYMDRGISLGSGDHHWMFQESKKTLQFQYTDGQIYLSNLHFEYLHHIQDRQVGMVRYEVTESFSLFCGAPTPRPNGFVPDRTFARSGNLYSRKYQYEQSFWEQFHLAKQNPLPNEVMQTFSSKIPLDEQFKRNGE